MSKELWRNLKLYLIHEGGPYYIETSPLSCRANQWTVFYLIGTSVMKELKDAIHSCIPLPTTLAWRKKFEPNTFKSKILPMLKKWFRMSWLPEEKEKGWKRKSKTEIKTVKKTEIKKERNRFEKNSHQNVCMESVNVIWNKCVFLSLRNWDQIWLVAIFILQKLKSSIFLLVLKVKWVTSLKF